VTEIAGSSPADRIALEPSGIIPMAKKKVTPKSKPGPKAETVKIDGDWRDAVQHALKRGKPPKPKSE
jgi:hypothetical protein